MTLQEALRFLNLNKNCTEKELKISYRNLIRKYHPDLCIDNDKKIKYEEISKKINEANRIVKEHLKSNNKINTNNNDIEKTKINILKCLRDCLKININFLWSYN